jgi:Xaa-Pro aminopeptidase
LENLIAARQAEDNGFICFDTLTLCPFDRRLIRAELLLANERRWMDDYHQNVLVTLLPLLPEDCQRWLNNACAPI